MVRVLLLRDSNKKRKTMNMRNTYRMLLTVARKKAIRQERTKNYFVHVVLTFTGVERK